MAQEDKKYRFSRRSLPKGKVEAKAEAAMKEEKMAEELKEIYQNGDGSMPDMFHFERRREGWNLFKAASTFLLSLVFLGAAAAAALFILEPNSGFNDADVAALIDAPGAIEAGGVIAYRLVYTNHQPVALTNVVLSVRYPDGFLFVESSIPADDGNSSWQFGRLDAGETAELQITGRLFGDIGQEQSLRAFLTYTPENFQSEFQKADSATTRIADAPITLVLGAPTEAAAGASGDIVLTLESKNGAHVQHIELELSDAEGLVVTSVAPSASAIGPYRWSVKPLTSTSTYTVKASFVGVPDRDEVTVAATVRGWSDEKKIGSGYVLARVALPVRIKRTAIHVSMAVNGTMSGSDIRPGDALSGSIVVKNDSAESQSDVVVRALFDAPSAARQSLLRWSDLADPYSGDVVGEQLGPGVRRGIITWSANEVPGLGSIPPGASVTIDFSLPVKTKEEIDFDAISETMVIAAADIRIGKGPKQQILSGSPITLFVVSDARLEVRDEPMNTPDGKESHRLSWILTNAFHELTSTTISADLFGDVSVDPLSISAGVGRAAFDATKKKITWTIDRLPTALDTAALQFTVVLNSANPTQTQLSSKVTGQATDTVAQKSIPIVGDEVLLR